LRAKPTGARDEGARDSRSAAGAEASASTSGASASRGRSLGAAVGGDGERGPQGRANPRASEASELAERIRIENRAYGRVNLCLIPVVLYRSIGSGLRAASGGEGSEPR